MQAQKIRKPKPIQMGLRPYLLGLGFLVFCILRLQPVGMIYAKYEPLGIPVMLWGTSCSGWESAAGIFATACLCSVCVYTGGGMCAIT